MTIGQGIKRFFAAINAKFSSTHDEENINAHDSESSDASSSGAITIASLRSDSPIPGRTVAYQPSISLSGSEEIESLIDSGDYSTTRNVPGRSAPCSPSPPR